MAQPGLKSPNLDTVTTINRDGSRYLIHPADVWGNMTFWRRLSAVFLIAVYVALPWIPVNGHPAVFLDVAQMRFHLMGITLAPQDMWMGFFLVSGLAFTLFFVTALLGRVWCGWACPQTVFLEHVFRRIERWIEGDANDRRKLDRAPWGPEKAFKRIAKHGVFIVLASLIAHIFLSYFISIPELWRWMRSAPTEHWGHFVFIVVATLVLYVNFAWFREQLCLIICPYGRLQSALIDEDTVNVAYDYKRGNPPGKANDPEAGDCVACRRCIQVCPTGIDIRQGLQLECVACAACIDACDAIMDKLKRPRGLIRYASERALEGQKRRNIRPRTIVYSILLLIGAAVATSAFSQMEKAIATVTRMPGPPYYVTDSVVRNQYEVRLINKDVEPLSFTASAFRANETLHTAGFEDPVTIAPLAEETVTFVILVPHADYNGKFEASVVVESSDAELRIERKVEFLGPSAQLLREKYGT